LGPACESKNIWLRLIRGSIPWLGTWTAESRERKGTIMGKKRRKLINIDMDESDIYCMKTQGFVCISNDDEKITIKINYYSIKNRQPRKRNGL
jgi:hypothetical protein